MGWRVLIFSASLMGSILNSRNGPSHTQRETKQKDLKDHPPATLTGAHGRCSPEDQRPFCI